MKPWVCAASLVAMLASGCGSDSTIVSVNHPPTISFTFVPLGVPAGVPVNLTVSVSDEDANDALTVTWEITNGTLTPKNAGKTVMECDVPNQLGTESVTVTVTDGEETRSTTQELKIGTIAREAPLVTYDLAGSPYILRPDNEPPKLLIGNAVTATVEAGVEILVDLPTTTIDITGTLNLNGTLAQPVVIRANDRRQLCQLNRSWWDGILVGTDLTYDGVINMNYAEVWHAKNGIRLRDKGRATVTNSLFSCCGSNAILMEGAGSLVVSDCEITNTQTNGIAVSTPSLPQSVSITGCSININGGTGVLLDLHDQFQQVPITIEGNRLEFNFTHGISMKNWAWPTIHNNAFYGNGDLGLSNIRLFVPFHDASSPDDLDVSCNYWGAVVTSQSTIENTVYDRVETALIGTRLLVAPWLNSDPYQAASPPPCDGGTAR